MVARNESSSSAKPAPHWARILLVAAVAAAGCEQAADGAAAEGGDAQVTADAAGDATGDAAESDESESEGGAGADTSEPEGDGSMTGFEPDGELEEDAAGPELPSVPCPDDQESFEIAGLVHVDGDDSDRSPYASGLESADDVPAVGVVVELRAPDGSTVDATACDGGWFGFGGVEPGVYLVTPKLAPHQRCSTRNCPRRFPAAVAEGKARIVTLGDSIPVVGDPVMFPERVATLFAPLVEIEDVNLAVAGTTSKQWLPGTYNWSKVLAPQLAGTDVFVISLGGNDILEYASDPSILNDLEAAKAGAKTLILQVVDNLLTIVAAIRAANPEADIVYCLYPNYGQAVNTFPWGAVNSLMGPELLPEVLSLARDSLPIEDGVLLVDMFGAAEGLALDAYMYDTLHFNSLGQTLYAEEVFRTLGGVWIGEESPLPSGVAPLGVDRIYGIWTDSTAP